MCVSTAAVAQAPGASGTPPSNPQNSKIYYDVITTGAPTAHAYGFKKGGLWKHQKEVAEVEREIFIQEERVRKEWKGKE